MERRWRIGDNRLQIILLFHLTAAFHSGFAQTLTLDEILLQLQGNLDHYDKQVTNFFCSEHVVSSLIYGKKQQSTVTDSISSGLILDMPSQ